MLERKGKGEAEVGGVREKWMWVNTYTNNGIRIVYVYIDFAGMKRSKIPLRIKEENTLGVEVKFTSFEINI